MWDVCPLHAHKKRDAVACGACVCLRGSLQRGVSGGQGKGIAEAVLFTLFLHATVWACVGVVMLNSSLCVAAASSGIAR